MKSLNFFTIVGFALFISCSANNDKRQMVEKVTGLENNLMADSLGPVDRLKAQELIQAYENFAAAYPEDSLSPEYLYRGAELAMNLQMSGRAVQTFQKILTTYPDFDKSALCIFLQAFIYENQMQQYDEAKKLYREFLEKHPGHELAEDALVSIQNMGKSLEELIKSWEE